MWYVKKYTNNNFYFFLLNFILTMWYVKVFDNLKSSFAELDFILTKWYVKPIEPTYLNVSPIRFYINYVEKNK